MSGVAKPQLESRARTEKLRPISGRDLWPRSEFLMYELAVYQFRAIYSNTGVECARLVSQMRVIVKVMIELSSRIVQKNVCVHAFERKNFIPHIASTYVSFIHIILLPFFVTAHVIQHNKSRSLCKCSDRNLHKPLLRRLNIIVVDMLTEFQEKM